MKFRSDKYIIPIIPYILTETLIATLAATRGQNDWIKKSISLHEHLLFLESKWSFKKLFQLKQNTLKNIKIRLIFVKHF